MGWENGIPRKSRARIVTDCAGVTAAPSFILKIIYNTNSESGGVLAHHITEDALGMIRAWLSAIKECADDSRISTIAQTSGYVCLGLQAVLEFVDLYLAAPDEGMNLRLSACPRLI